MSEFDPSKPAQVHDELNDNWFEWELRWASTYKLAQRMLPSPARKRGPRNRGRQQRGSELVA
jgi:hypothetical protein